ncbi:MAG: acyl carrier protein [Gemmataceae bacterium]|nr:acyl carrier protein [Gemmataceae bacterium]
MSLSAQEIQEGLIARLSRLLVVAPHELDPREPVRRFGLDSMTVLALVAEVEEWLGYRFRSNPLEDHPTIEALAVFLARETANQGQ